MMEQAQQTLQNNPWRDRSALPCPPRGRILLSVAGAALSAFTLAWGWNDQRALPLLALLFACVVLIARTPHAVVLPLLCASAAVLLTLQFAAGAAVLACIVGVACLVFLLTACPRGYFALTVIPAACLLARLLTQDAIASLLPLLLLPATGLLTAATLTYQRRTVAVCMTAVGFLAVLLLGVWLVLGRIYGTLELPALVSAVRNTLNETLTAFLNELFDTLYQSAGEDEELREAVSRLSVSTLQLVPQTVAQAVNLSPAVATVICLVLGYAAQGLLTAHDRMSGLGAVVTPHVSVLTMSVTASVLYTVALLISMFASSLSIAVAVAQNVCLILMPGLLVIGAQGVRRMLAHAGGGRRTGLLLLLAALLCCNVGSILYILALWGAYDCIMAAVQAKMIEKLKEKNGEDGPDGRE